MSTLPHRAASTVILATAISLVFACWGCGPGHHIDRVRAFAPDADAHALELKRFPKNRQATEALVFALDQPYAEIRYLAADAIGAHIGSQGEDVNEMCLAALINALGDARTATVSVPVFGPLLPGMTCFTGSVRSRALLTLTVATRKDFGLDVDAWSRYLAEREGFRPSGQAGADRPAHPYGYAWVTAYDAAASRAATEGQELRLLLAPPWRRTTTDTILRALYSPEVLSLLPDGVNCFLADPPPKLLQERGLTKLPALVIVAPTGRSHNLERPIDEAEVVNFVRASRDAEDAARDLPECATFAPN